MPLHEESLLIEYYRQLSRELGFKEFVQILRTIDPDNHSLPAITIMSGAVLAALDPNNAPRVQAEIGWVAQQWAADAVKKRVNRIWD